jgi:hypothetical protein
MQTRRGFFGAACAAIAAVSGALTAVADSTVVQRTRTYIRMQYRANTWPANLSAAWPSNMLSQMRETPEAPTEYVVVCSGSSRRDLVKLVHAMRDAVWAPKLRRQARKSTVKIYMDAYEHMLTCIDQCKTTGEYQLLFYTNFLVDCTPDLPTKLLEHDVVLHDECTNTVMRRFKSSTKNGRTKTREVIRTES